VPGHSAGHLDQNQAIAVVSTKTHFDRIDAMINNAAVLTVGPMERPSEMLQQAFATNVSARRT